MNLSAIFYVFKFLAQDPVEIYLQEDFVVIDVMTTNYIVQIVLNLNVLNEKMATKLEQKQFHQNRLVIYICFNEIKL